MPIEIDVILGVLFLFSLLWAIVMGMANAEKILDRLSKPQEGTGEKNRSGMKKIEELKNRLGNLAMTDDRPAVWRICRSLVESLDEVQKEHDAELEELREKVTAAEANSEEYKNECRAAEEIVTELEGQLKAMSDLANSAMADAQKWQNAYLNLRVETPIVQKIDVKWRNGEIPDGTIIMSRQAEMASESKLRTQKWIDNGCNGFDMKSPKSTPMAFWFEQDVLAYIKLNGLEIASVYGDVVAEYQGEDNMDGQMSIADYSEFGVFDLERPLLTTTGCARTGCIACGFGIHLEKPPCSRLYAIEKLSNQKVLDWFLRGGSFDGDGLWKPDNRGLGFWFVYEWINQNGSLRKPLEFPHRQEYIEKYHTELTDKYLYEGLKYRT